MCASPLFFKTIQSKSYKNITNILCLPQIVKHIEIKKIYMKRKTKQKFLLKNNIILYYLFFYPNLYNILK
ncbi:hypothetical protein PFBG_03290 [Plasmodium falciparum 7G8]|uniref:Uncharacterized protein n=2 Tax=Plasmodium falciparum TaxID=5833 RepID=W7F5F9_PLAF8|nr:hypothetical protein PFNF135_03375 [Plasmodium falciparum NF135/5.C10]EUR70060.1 hypothetical protein PFBG_03290 [Plasmodium falciparum 7G8]